jgi:hypothetical protein
VDRKTSLLHFVVKELQKTAPGVEFLSTVGRCTAVEFIS